MSMAAKLSNLGDKTFGANLQMEGHIDVPSQSAQRANRSQNPWVVLPPTCCPGPQPGGHLQATLILDIALRYM